MAEEPLVIGLVGSFGSGCSYIAQHILNKNDMPGGAFQYRSLSKALRVEASSYPEFQSKSDREKNNIFKN